MRLNKFIIKPNEFLRQHIQAYYRCDYLGYGKEGNPDYINCLKNTFNSNGITALNNAVNELKNGLKEELYDIINDVMQYGSYDRSRRVYFEVVTVPRSKSRGSYTANQLLFSKTIHSVVSEMSRENTDALFKGKSNEYSVFSYVNCISRHTDTRTTHLSNTEYGIGGSMPYVGITRDTCYFSPEMNGNGKNSYAILIDDIYTKTVNVDEDCIQVLLDRGFNVVFFAIARTARKY